MRFLSLLVVHFLWLSRPWWWPIYVQQSHDVQGDYVQLLTDNWGQTGDSPAELAVHQLLDVSTSLGHDVHDEDSGLILNQTSG